MSAIRRSSVDVAIIPHEKNDNNKKNKITDPEKMGEDFEPTSTTTTSKMSLKKGIITVMSLMIGSGIFSNSNAIQQKVGGSPILALGVWLVTGLFSLMGALCYAELGTMIPGSGGEAAYLLKVGAWASSLFDWTSIVIMKPGSLAALALPFASHFLEALKRAMSKSELPKPGLSMAEIPPLISANGDYRFATGIAIAMIWVVTLAASWSTSACERVVGVLTYSKLIGLACICIIGLFSWFFYPLIFFMHFHGAISTKLTSFNILEFSKALNDGLWAFDGWNNLNIVAGNLENPSRNLPLAIWISVSLVLGMYLLTMLAYYAVVDEGQFAVTETIAIQFGQNVCKKPGAVALALMVCASVFAASLSGMYTSSEIIVLSAQRRFFPRFLQTISKGRGTAINAYVSQGILASLYVLIPRALSVTAFDTLITIYTMPTWFFYGSCVLLVLALRIKEPKAERPYRVWLSTPLLFLTACLWLIVTTFIHQWEVPAIAFVLVLVGLPIYYLRRSHMIF